MSECDVMKVLADANPVRVEDLAATDFPGIPRSRPSRRLVLAFAVVTAAVAASLISVFAFGSASRHRGASGFQVVPPPTLAHPFEGAQQTSLSDAKQALGAPIVLPDSSLASPADVGAVWSGSFLDERRAAVTFPSAGLIVLYWRPALYAAPRPLFAAVAKSSKLFHLLDLEGVPALAADQNSDSTGTNFGSIEFDTGGTTIAVLGHYDQATLQTVAQSILNRSGGTSQTITPAGTVATMARPLGRVGQRVSLAVAASELGRAVTLPDSAQLNSSNVGAVWAATAAGGKVSIAVTFPSRDLIVRYSRPPIPDPLANYQAFVKNSPWSGIFSLNGGVPALAIPRISEDPSSWYSIEFVAGATTIVVMGQTNEPTLQRVAQSILDRSK